ncbi:OmpA family protein, partial [Klebsiella pneumoniae]
YLHVADEEQLIRQAEVLLADRPAWASQLCVACTVVPVVHLDMAVLAGRLRRFVGGLATVRRRAGIKVPLLLWSWLPGTGREDDLPWFICAGGKVQVATPAGESSPTAWAAQPGTDG